MLVGRPVLADATFLMLRRIIMGLRRQVVIIGNLWYNKINGDVLVQHS